MFAATRIGLGLCLGLGFTLLAVAPVRADEKLDRFNKVVAASSCLIEANRIVRLSSQVQGTLAEVGVRRGDRVTRGQIVARLDSTVEQAQLEALRLKAETDVYIRSKSVVAETTRASVMRQRELGRRDVASAQQVQKAEMEHEVALAELAQAELDRNLAALDLQRAEGTMNRRVLRAPVDGVVTRVALSPGEFADPQQAAMEIAETSVLRVELFLPLEVYPAIRLGMKARVQPQEPIGGSHPVTVVSRDGTIDSASGLFQVQFHLANEDGRVPGGIRCTIRFDEM